MKLFVKKEKKQKDPLLHTYFVSLLSLLLCVAMFMGTTFAWFSSDVSSSDNQIFVGTLEVSVKHWSKGYTDWKPVVDGEKILNPDIHWEPGYTTVEWLQVENTGDLSFNYRLTMALDVNADSYADSKEALDKIGGYFTVYANTADNIVEHDTIEEMQNDADWVEIGTLSEVMEGKSILSGSLAAKAPDAAQAPMDEVAFAIHMNESTPAVLADTNTADEIDDSYSIMGRELKGITVKLEAWQAGGDSDSLGSDYDNLVTTEEELQAAFAQGGKIILMEDVELTKGLTVASGKEVYLNLNGRTISQTEECTASYQMIENNGTLTVADSSAGKTGKISLTDTGKGDPDYGWGTYTIRNNGNLVVNDGTVEIIRTQIAERHCSLAIFQYSGTTVINGGNIINRTFRSLRLWKGSVVINGGSFEGQVWVHCVDDSASLTINGGSFSPAGGDLSSVFVDNEKDKTTHEAYAVDFSVTGGSFETKIAADLPDQLAGCITGGTFTDAVKENMEAVLFSSDFK